MRIDDVKFTNIELLKEYVMILKEKKKNPGRNIEKLFNSFFTYNNIKKMWRGV